MSVSVQKKIQLIDNTVYHHGLVNILTECHLQSIGDNWENFLVRNHFEEKTLEQPSGSRTLRGRKRKIETVIEQEPHHQQDFSEDDIPIVEILQKMNIENLKRKKSNKKTKVLPQIKTLLQKYIPKVKENKIQMIPTTNLRRSTKLNIVKEAASKAAKHIDLESKEKSKDLEDSLRESLRFSPRVSPPPIISPPKSPVQSPGIDLVH